MNTYRFLYEADIVLVMDGGRITLCGHPRKVLPQVERQLQETKDEVRGERVGGAKGGAMNKGDTGSIRLQVNVHCILYIHIIYKL